MCYVASLNSTKTKVHFCEC